MCYIYHLSLLLGERLVTTSTVDFFRFLPGGENMKAMLVDDINMKRQKSITNLTIIIHLEAPSPGMLTPLEEFIT